MARCETLAEILSSPGSEDKSPHGISISDDSDLKGVGAIKDAAKVRTVSKGRLRESYSLSFETRSEIFLCK